MSAIVTNWKRLFYFCFGLLLASGFCLKWIEDGFISNGKLFTIFDLELFLDKADLEKIFRGMELNAKMIVDNHLHFDFFFMAGVFPGIASICMLVRERVKKSIIRNVLFALASLQLAAWSFDIYENLHLIKWLKNPETIDGIGFFHLLVKLKFIIAITGILVSAIAFLFYKLGKNRKSSISLEKSAI